MMRKAVRQPPHPAFAPGEEVGGRETGGAGGGDAGGSRRLHSGAGVSSLGRFSTYSLLRATDWSQS